MSRGSYRTGLDRLLTDPALRRPLVGKRVGLLTRPAAVTAELTHAADALAPVLAAAGARLTALFGPQHGARGDKQDNMIASEDEYDARLGVPVYSLYGERLRPTPQQLAEIDVLLVDLQDIGCRVYTYLTTLRYVLEEAANARVEVWVLERPNPIGRAVEGFCLQPNWESFVGAGACALRHGMTLAEAGIWFVESLRLDVAYRFVGLDGWTPDAAPGYGWPPERVWVPPSPNAPTPWMARCYPGTVMLEGTTLSEGRGTTRPLECFGAPGLDPYRWRDATLALAPPWCQGAVLRPLWFEPTFHKHAGQRCGGLMIHTEPPGYAPSFRPWRCVSAALKALRALQPEFDLWRQFPYEFEHERLAIDLINGGPMWREWVDDPTATPADLDALVAEDERAWQEQRRALIARRGRYEVK